MDSICVYICVVSLGVLDSGLLLGRARLYKKKVCYMMQSSPIDYRNYR